MLPDPCGTIFEWCRYFGKFKARPYPGGPLIDMIRFQARPGAKYFHLEHRWEDYSILLNADNDADLPSSVGEVTRPGKKGAGWHGEGGHAQIQQVLWRRKYDGHAPMGLDGQEYHGTPAMFLCDFESDGTWGGKIYDPETISPQDWAALPDCIRARFPEVIKGPFGMDALVEQDLKPEYRGRLGLAGIIDQVPIPLLTGTVGLAGVVVDQFLGEHIAPIGLAGKLDPIDPPTLVGSFGLAGIVTDFQQVVARIGIGIGVNTYTPLLGEQLGPLGLAGIVEMGQAASFVGPLGLAGIHEERHLGEQLGPLGLAGIHEERHLGEQLGPLGLAGIVEETHFGEALGPLGLAGIHEERHLGEQLGPLGLVGIVEEQHLGEQLGPIGLAGIVNVTDLGEVKGPLGLAGNVQRIEEQDLHGPLGLAGIGEAIVVSRVEIGVGVGVESMQHPLDLGEQLGPIGLAGEVSDLQTTDGGSGPPSGSWSYLGDAAGNVGSQETDRNASATDEPILYLSFVDLDDVDRSPFLAALDGSWKFRFWYQVAGEWDFVEGQIVSVSAWLDFSFQFSFTVTRPRVLLGDYEGSTVKIVFFQP